MSKGEGATYLAALVLLRAFGLASLWLRLHFHDRFDRMRRERLLAAMSALPAGSETAEHFRHGSLYVRSAESRKA